MNKIAGAIIWLGAAVMFSMTQTGGLLLFLMGVAFILVGTILLFKKDKV